MTSEDSKSAESLSKDQLELQQLRRRSCIFKLLIMWFTIMVLVIIGMIVVRSHVVREPDAVMREISDFLTIEQLPDGFTPYSFNSFWGMTLCVFNHEDHIREDGRTTSIIAVNIDDRFEGMSVEEARNSLFRNLERRLEKREFNVRKRETRTLEQDGKTVEIFIFEGTHLMEKDHVPATACYRFMEGPTIEEGKAIPIYIHTMGLNQSFGKERQLEAMMAFQPRK